MIAGAAFNSSSRTNVDRRRCKGGTWTGIAIDRRRVHGRIPTVCFRSRHLGVVCHGQRIEQVSSHGSPLTNDRWSVVNRTEVVRFPLARAELRVSV